MAEGGNEDNKKYSPSKFYNDEETDGADQQPEPTNNQPDLFNDNVVLNIHRKLSHDNLSSASQNEQPRREENPFSFKHFLNRDIPSNSNAHNNYQQTGARPKVFSSTRQHSLPATNYQNVIPEPHRMSSVDNVRSEFPSALPDFVQDHLVVEQCYLQKDEIDNMPDFTLNNRSNNTNDNSNKRWRTRVDFPLDLPLSNDEEVPPQVSSSGSRSCPQSGEVSKSLPDFLSDGPIHSDRSNVATNESPVTENHTSDERLRDEVRSLRQQVYEKNMRIENLESEVSAIRLKEKKYMDALTKSMEQVEGNLNSSNKRVLSAEHMVTKMKNEIKNLKSEVSQLRTENTLLRESGGAIGGGFSEPSTSNQQSRRLAQELRGAASSAEQTLRHLLTGLNNLRVIADSVENMNRVEDRTDFYFTDTTEPGDEP